MASPKAADSHPQQLARLRAEVQALQEQLKHSQRLATLGTMAAMVAHEFNNILTPIISYAQAAKDNPSLTAKALARASDGGQRASHICKALLGLSAGDDAAAEIVGAQELVDRTLSAMAREPAKDGIELACRVPPGMTIRTRAGELQQVLLNLLLNARSAVLARPAPRKIEITASARDGQAILEVADNGVGIAPENLQRIFQPFFTTKKGAGTGGDGSGKGTRPSQDGSAGGDSGMAGGSGLGLAVCRQILTGLGGSISVTSTPGQGSTFCVKLPLELPAAATCREAAATA